jgi:ergothioneine biosynthesis protein EgtB
VSLNAEIRAALAEARAQTLELFATIADVDFCRQPHTDFSPLGWHLGHIGVAESFWILQQCQKQTTLSVAYDQFFTPTDTPKPERINLPPRAELLAYLATVRERVLAFVDRVDFAADHPLLHGGGIFNMLLQHEEQHIETMLLIKQLLAAAEFNNAKRTADIALLDSPHPGSLPSGERGLVQQRQDMVFVPAGPFPMGSNNYTTTLDNERPQHEMFVDAFCIARVPVTNRDFLRFLDDGGYRQESWWSPEGWQWRMRHAIEHPLYWRRLPDGAWMEIGQTGSFPLIDLQPVQHVSWYEADAYARSIGRRLPSEAEWEKAAGLGMLDGSGNVWEWTSTWFAPYAGFVAHPYEGYSTPYFDRQHRVLRGGSWATRRHVKKIPVRNW